jgi:tetratricopeptide (TPR) repeat protein
VHEGGERTATRLGFARDLHYGEYYAEALSAIDRVLEKQPANLEALTLKADIFEHQGEYRKAETLAHQVVCQDENYVDAWLVLADVYEAKRDWSQLVVTAAHGINATGDVGWIREALLAHRARANLELRDFENLARDLESLSETLGGKRTAAPLRAVLLLRTGHYEEAFRLADSHVAEKFRSRRAVFAAVRFEAAHKLGWPEKAGELSAEVLDVLRRKQFGDWVDRLASEYSL